MPQPFLSRKKKSCIRKLNTKNAKTTSNPKEILSEIQSFYANLYDKVDHSDKHLMEFPSLKTFQKNKTPGNHGLTVEF